MSVVDLNKAQDSGLIRRMTGRGAHEAHRVSTTLELLFDLVFVVAIALAGAGLHHAISANHVSAGVFHYLTVFFAIWWAWMGFTWFASSFDTDDVPYRLAVFVQMAGALIIAAGVNRAFEHSDFLVVTIGYAVMRFASVAQWLRAARESTHRPTAMRYAIGIATVQMGWFALLWMPKSVWLFAYIGMLLAEFAVPVWAEKAGRTPWHPHHISERYGLLTIIVLGESILACANAVLKGIDAGLMDVNFALFCLGALLIVFCMWWIYFGDEVGEQLHAGDNKKVFIWGYGHFFVFASAAAAGAGLGAQVDFRMGEATASALTVAYGLAVPVAIFVLFTWLVHMRVGQARGVWLFPVAASVILLTPWFTGFTTISIGLVLMLALIIRAALCGLNKRSAHV